MKQIIDSSIRRQLSPFLRTGRQWLTGKQPLIGEEKKGHINYEWYFPTDGPWNNAIGWSGMEQKLPVIYLRRANAPHTISYVITVTHWVRDCSLQLNCYDEHGGERTASNVSEKTILDLLQMIGNETEPISEANYKKFLSDTYAFVRSLHEHNVPISNFKLKG